MDNPNTVAESIDARPKSRRAYVPEMIVGAGYLLFFAALVVACVASLMVIYRPAKSKQTATATPSQPVTPTPHILSTPVAAAPFVLADSFNENANAWAPRYITGTKTEIKNGVLAVESLQDESYALVTCIPCLDLNQRYYVQAQFSTNKATDVGFGILIRLNASKDYFYLFEVNTESRKYDFWYHDPDNWYLRAGGSSDAIHSFPANNTLGLYVEKGRAEFYMNGQFIDFYDDSAASFDEGGMGFYLDDSGVSLQVDNLILQRLGGH